MGIKNILFKILPHRKTKEDLMRECGISIPHYNMYAAVGLNIYGVNDLGELAILTKTNLTAANIQEILECGTLNNNIQISIDDNYIDSVRSYLNE